MTWFGLSLVACGSADQPRTSTLIQSSPNTIGISSSEQVLRLDQPFYQIELRRYPDLNFPHSQYAQVRIEIRNPKSLDLSHDQVRVSLQQGTVGTSIKSTGARYRVSEIDRNSSWMNSQELWMNVSILIEAY